MRAERDRENRAAGYACERTIANDGRIETVERRGEDEPDQRDQPAVDVTAGEPATDAVSATAEPTEPLATVDGATAVADTLSEDLTPAGVSDQDRVPADDPSPDTPPTVADVVEELRDGLYEIIAGTSEALRMDVTDGSSANGARV